MLVTKATVWICDISTMEEVSNGRQRNLGIRNEEVGLYSSSSPSSSSCALKTNKQGTVDKKTQEQCSRETLADLRG